MTAFYETQINLFEYKTKLIQKGLSAIHTHRMTYVIFYPSIGIINAFKY
jgi:hypothetical protein